mmetsp:Transcript_32565/g.101605  ORF Transcript_32565/g.101605 Transcript_32565/m.101605 type:complete len:205 (+) Transcript_32565:67-681(+)
MGPAAERGASDAHAPRWHFLDATGRELGPHSSFEMRKWHARARFPEGRALLVRLAEWRWHAPLAALFPQPGTEFGAEPAWPVVPQQDAAAWAEGAGGQPAGTAAAPAAAPPGPGAPEAPAGARGEAAQGGRHWGTVVAVLPDRSRGLLRCDPEAWSELGYGCLVIPGRLLGDIRVGEELAFRFRMDGPGGLPQAVDLMRLTTVT